MEVSARNQRMAALRRRVRALKDIGWYDDFDLKRIGEWVKTMDLIEVEAVVGWGEQDFRESRTVTPWLSDRAMAEARKAVLPLAREAS